MALFRPHRLDQIALEIAHFGDGEAAKIDRCVRIGAVAIVTGWTTAKPDIQIAGTIFAETYPREDVEREIGPSGKGFIKACHLPASTTQLEVVIRVGRKRYPSRIEISDDPQTIATLGLEQQQFLTQLRTATRQILPESAQALTDAFGLAEAPAPSDAPVRARDTDTTTTRGTATEVAAVAGDGQSAAAAIDEIVAVGDSGFLIVGWCISDGPAASTLRLQLSGQAAVDLLDGAFRVGRPDLLEALGAAIRAQAGRAGFLRFVGRPEGGESTLSVWLEHRGQRIATLSLPPIKRFDDPIATTQELLKHLHPGTQSMLELLDHQLGPALQQLPFKRAADIEPEVVAFGEAPSQPSASIIVPIYGRYDFVEFQLSQFANDPAFQTELDLIYVLDDPSLWDAFIDCCSAIAPIYEVPFRCILYRHNLGFAGANNIGVRQARADLVVLLNSDVLPSSPCWVAGLRERFEALADCGVLGARLLYPDGAIQHDGMAFRRLPSLAGLWINDHPGKGLPALPIDEERAVESVPAVTAACVMVRKADLVAIGGLDEGYILGDFEDSDLCLALLARGQRTYIAHDIVLYHLERQSQSLFEDRAWRDKVTVYNGWRHHRKWQTTLERIGAGAAT